MCGFYIKVYFKFVLKEQSAWGFLIFDYWNRDIFFSKLSHKIPSQDQSSPAFVDIKILVRGVQSEHIASIRGGHMS